VLIPREAFTGTATTVHAPPDGPQSIGIERKGEPECRSLLSPLRIASLSAPSKPSTASGLVIPDTAKEKPQEGEVVAVGPGRVDDNGNRVPVDVAEGDIVIYSKYGGTEVKHGGTEYLVLSARDVLAVVVK
jgi:chaperonin GroES